MFSFCDLLFDCCIISNYQTEVNNVSQKNNEQSNLIKSIENPKFQDLLELHIYEYGSNIKAVSKALKTFKNSSASE